MRQFEGQTAHIEIVDETKGGWGHVNVDQIEFSDMPGNRAVMALLEELLPARFSAHSSGGQGKRQPAPGRVLTTWFCSPARPRRRRRTARRLLTRPVGKGRVVLAARRRARAGAGGDEQPARRSAYAFLCGLVGANYTGSGGRQHPKAPGFGTLALAALARQDHRPARFR